jgi:hypothetical protein
MARTRQGWKVAVAAATGAAVFSGLTAFVKARHEPVTADQAAQTMLSDPAVGRYITVLKQTFPDDYRTMMQTTAADVNAGITSEQARTAGFALSASLVARHQADIARAPDAELIALTRAHGALLGDLDDARCAHLFMAGLQPGEVLPDAAKAHMADVGADNLLAARAGIDHPVPRPRTLTPEDRAALVAGLRAHGLTAAELDVFQRNTLAATSPHDQCAIGRALYAAVAALPSPQAGRLASVLVTPG